MITNMQKSVISELNESARVFKLTGSRYFGNSQYNSDYDFFTSEDSGIESFLQSLGFHRQETSIDTVDYLDSNCAFVMHHPAENIHVQVVRNFAQKEKAQEFLKSFPFAGIQDKATRKAIWNWALHQTK